MQFEVYIKAGNSKLLWNRKGRPPIRL